MEENKQFNVFYIEPNNSISDADNITWNPEEYNISVDLEVITPNRLKYGGFNDISKQNRRTIFSGTSGYKDNNGKNRNFLTDSFSFISYDELRNEATGINEQLGIESINIKYDKNMFPIVSMKMVDIRGYSLFQPSEISKANGEARITPETFFESIFKFPYPLFLLTIKGFFGSKVTYRLAVTDFKASFNSEVSNFEINIAFIGHMYGIYTDIPMQFLYIAPYIGSMRGEKNNVWNTISSQGLEGKNKADAIPTLKEIVENYKNCNDSLTMLLRQDSANSNGFMGKVNECIRQIRSCEDTIAAYRKFLSDMDISDDGITMIPGEKNAVKTPYENTCIFSDTEEITIPESYQAFLNTLKNLDFIKEGSFKLRGLTQKTADNVVLFPQVNTENRWAVDERFSGKNISESHEKYLSDKGLYEQESISGIKYTEESILVTDLLNYGLGAETDNIVKQYKYNKEQYVCFLPIEKDMLNFLNGKINEIKQVKEKLITESLPELNDNFEKSLGFKPTVKNVHKILYAHLACLMEIYYNYLDDINEKGSKKNRRLNINPNSNITTDIQPFGNESSVDVPPFPMVYEKRVESKEIGKYYEKLGLKDRTYFSESELVDKILSGVALYGGNNDDTIVPVNQYGSTDNKDMKVKHPISVFDYLYEAVGESGPYDSLKKISRASELPKKIFEILLYRIWQFNTPKISEEEKSKKIKREIENIWDAINQNIKIKAPSKLINEIESYVQTKLFKEDVSEYNKKKEYLTIVPNVSTKDNGKNSVYLSGKNIMFSGFTGEVKNNVNYSIYKENGFYKDTEEFLRKNKEAEKDTNANTIGMPYYKSVFYGQGGSKPVFDETKNPNDICFPFLTVIDEGKTVSVATFIKEHKITDISDKWYCVLSTLINGKDNNIFDKLFELLLKDYFIKVPKYIIYLIGSYFSITNKNKLPSIYMHGNYILNSIFYRNQNVNYLTKFASNKDLAQFSIFKEEFNKFANSIEGKTLLATILDSSNLLGQAEPLSYNSTVASQIGKLFTEDFLAISAGINSTGMRFERITLVKQDSYSPETITSRVAEDVNVSSIILQTYNGILDKARNRVNRSERNNTDDPIDNTTITDEQKFALYTTLKNLYDKWLCGFDKNVFSLNKGGEYENFSFVDSLYRDISDTFIINPQTFVDMINSITSGEQYSFFQFVTNLAHKSKLLFMPLPFFRNINQESLEKMFEPQFNSNIRRTTENEGPKYVFMYTNEPSNKLEEDPVNSENKVGYKSDGIVFEFNRAEKNKEYFNDISKDVVAFGINVGQQNQSIFRNVTITMDNPRETEQSLSNLYLLSQYAKGGSTTAIRGNGQDLFKIYSSRSYDCRVDMLGCAEILPGMYFQINNVPMFHGAYMIFNVEHRIQGNEMTTSFVGQKISKYCLPTNQYSFDVNSILSQISELADTGNTTVLSGEIVDNSRMEGLLSGTLNGGLKDLNTFNKLFKQNSKTFDVPKAIARMYGSFSIKTVKNGTVEIQNAFENQRSKGVCSGVVLRCVYSGFDEEFNGGNNGYDSYKSLCNLGFKPILGFEQGTESIDSFINKVNINTMPGDIAIILKRGDGTKDKPGHICMKCHDGRWHSDFKQGAVANKEVVTKLYIFRYAGKIKPVGDMGTNNILCSNSKLSFGESGQIISVQHMTPYTLTVFPVSGDVSSKDNWQNNIIIRDEEGNKVNFTTTLSDNKSKALCYINCVTSNLYVDYNA